MINAAKEAFSKQGLPMDQLFSDSFEYAAENEDKPEDLLE